MTRFRDFLYIDDDLVERLLSGIEGGAFDEVQEMQSESAGSDNAGTTSDGINQSFRSGSGSERQRILRQTAETRFSRLWQAVELTEKVLKATVVPNEASEDLWPAREYGSFCSLVGDLATPPTLIAISAADELRNFFQLGTRLGFISPGGNESEKLEQMAALKELIKESFPVTLSLGQQQPAIVLPLTAQYSRVKIHRFMGRATVVGRIVEITESGDTLELVEIPGIGDIHRMSRQQLRAAKRGGRAPDPAGLSLSGPVLTLRVIAIFQ